MAERIFLVSDDRLASYHWRAGYLSEPTVFAGNDDGLGQFRHYLDRDPHTPSRLLVDLVEEEFREETVPHVVGYDRRALVGSRLERMFRDTTYSHAIAQGREPEGRRDDRLLFTALVRPELVARWMELIGELKVPLAGIYSLPIVSQQLLRPLGIRSTHALLVTQHSTGGLRQTLFVDCQLKLSRLALMTRAGCRAHAAEIIGEVAKFRRYLTSLRMLSDACRLDAYVVAEAAVLEDLHREASDRRSTRHHLLSIEDVARKIGARKGYRSSHAEWVFVHALASNRQQRNHYAVPEQMRYHALAALRSGMHSATAVALVASLPWSLVKFAEGAAAARDASSVGQHVAVYEARYRRARERMPGAPVAATDLRQAVELARVLGQYRTSPASTMRVISARLIEFPRLHVDQFTWRSQGTTDADAARYELAHVTGRVAPDSGSRREALEIVSRFVARIRQEPDVHDVRVVSPSLGLGSAQPLSGDVGPGATLDSAPFELRVLLKGRPRDV